jgi:hypothetical protein
VGVLIVAFGQQLINAIVMIEILLSAVDFLLFK